MLTVTSIIDRARAISAETSDATLTSLYADATGREAQASMARALVIVQTAAVRGVKVTTRLFDIGASQVSNVRKQVSSWSDTGFTDAYIGKAWTLVTSSREWGQKWGTDEGKALMAAIQGQDTDEGKYALLTGTELPVVEKVLAATDLINALTRAETIAGEVSVSDEDRAVIDTLLLSIAGLTASVGAQVAVAA